MNNNQYPYHSKIVDILDGGNCFKLYFENGRSVTIQGKTLPFMQVGNYVTVLEENGIVQVKPIVKSYSLHFNETSQHFTIIETGATISPYLHGDDILMSNSIPFLVGICTALKARQSRFTAAYLRELLNGIGGDYENLVEHVEIKQAE